MTTRHTGLALIYPPTAAAMLDSLARQLYEAFSICPYCSEPLTLADSLRCKCPSCGSDVKYMGDQDSLMLTPEGEALILDELLKRRAALGLPA
jgi:transcription initiation factor IIE alpha subunit